MGNDVQTTQKSLLGQFSNCFSFFIHFQFLRTVYNKAIRKTRPLAIHLEKDIFPELKETGHRYIRLFWNEGGCVKWESATREHIISNTEFFPEMFSGLPVNELILDTSLEANQITDFIVLVFSAMDKTNIDLIVEKNYSAISNRVILDMLEPEKGHHKFCMKIFFDPGKKIIRVDYSYCELFFSSVISRYLSRSSEGDHRDLFYIAPRAGLFITLLLMSILLLFLGFETHKLLLSLALSFLFGGGVWYFWYTIGSLRYDNEHRERLLAESAREMRALSYFPENNPNMVLKFSASGELLYSNPAAEKVIKSGEISLDEILPKDFMDKLSEIISGSSVKFEWTETILRASYQYTMGKLGNFDEVVIVATDISHLMELENELRMLNADLENKVIERTKQLKDTRDVTILTLSSLAETRDPETGAHIDRTSAYVRILAQELRNIEPYKTALDSDETIDLLYRSAPLHDIGKVGIPDRILQKPGKLTADEFKIMMSHPILGGDALKKAEDLLGGDSFLHYALEIAYTHHEKWDGSGYPYGLMGENIPISGRLMALADVYDALISKRVYKEAFSHEKAREIIINGRGTHFEPIIVDTFVANEVQFKQIAEKFQD